MTSVTSPREGLPPCILGLSIHDGRVAGWANCVQPTKHVQDYLSQGGQRPLTHTLYTIQAGQTDMERQIKWHGISVPLPVWGGLVLDVDTDDPDEARAAFELGREYVRTGVLE